MKEHQSDQISDLVKALVSAQMKIKGVEKSGKNPYFNSDYSELSDVWKACKDPLASNGLAITQTVDQDEHGPLLITTLAHMSGQWMKSYYPLMLTKKDSQGMGAAITYARRYALQAMVGICPVDDDGEAAMELSDKDKDRLLKAIGSDEKLTTGLRKKFNVYNLTTINRAQFSETMKFLTTRKARGGVNGETKVA